MKRRNFMPKRTALVVTAVCSVILLAGCGGEKEEEILTFTNVSYDPTREFYEAYNKLFAEHYKEETGKEIELVQSHGGSGSQARSVIEGNDADVVTLALAHDITSIEKAGLIEEGWLDEFDKNSSPYTSTIVFGVEVITPDPKSSGGACWNFLAAWRYAETQFAGDETAMKDFLAKLYNNVLVMDSGARGATTTFVENGQGDVLIAWENEALLAMEEYPDEYELVTPSISILAEPSVAIVDENAEKNGTEEIAKDYLDYLYTEDAQRLAGYHYYRPSDETILKEFSDTFDLTVNLCTIDDFGGWDQAYQDFFADDAIFDEIYRK